MTGSKYSYAITQLETQGVLHPDYHMFVQEDFYLLNPNVMAHVMTQLSLPQEWSEAMGWQSVYSGNIGDEETTFLEQI